MLLRDHIDELWKKEEEDHFFAVSVCRRNSVEIVTIVWQSARNQMVAAGEGLVNVSALNYGYQRNRLGSYHSIPPKDYSIHVPF